MPSEEEKTSTRNFFRVPCEFQIRFRVIDEEEFKVFESYAMRPSTHSRLRGEIEGQLRGMEIREQSKSLFEKAFQILLNIDQRLERMEEMLLEKAENQSKLIKDSYEWVHGDISAGGISCTPKAHKGGKVGYLVLLDVLLPMLPEYRLVAAGKVARIEKNGEVGFEFSAIHEDDREFLHRFVISREREMLRSKADGHENSKSEG